MIRFAGFALAALLLGVAAGAQVATTERPARYAKRVRETIWVTGRERTVRLGRLEPGRTYTISLDLSCFSDPTAVRARAHFRGVSGGAEMIVDRWAPSAEAAIRPEDRGPVDLTIEGLGELGDSLHVRIGRQAEPEPRMSGVEFIPSPNQNQRSAGASITAIVVHATVTPTTEATVDWFLTPRSQVSSHYVVGRDGRIVQMVEDTARAWHAGVSELDGVNGVNDYSVGIEIVNLNDGRDPFTDAQYEAAAAIIRHIRDQFDVPDSRIVSHESVARPKGRKNDPKGFDFTRLLRLSRDPMEVRGGLIRRGRPGPGDG